MLKQKRMLGVAGTVPVDMNFKKEYKPLIQLNFFKCRMPEIYKDYGMEPKPGLGNMWANHFGYPGSYDDY